MALARGNLMLLAKKPHVANKMLCFVIHGLSTKFLIPVGYFFHASLATNDFFFPHNEYSSNGN
jgi:hypothetical protein